MKKVFVLLFTLFCTIYCFSKPLDLEVRANNAILINADNSSVLFEKNAYQLAYPASITKMVIIWYVLENYLSDLNNLFIASENALKIINPETKLSSNYKIVPHILESDGSSFDIQLCEKLTLSDLLYGMVMSSGNDASNVVAESLAGSIESFMQNLNVFLKQKGFVNTTLCNPHGLHMPTHITTAYDIANIMKLALKNPKFLEIFSCKFYVRPKTNKQQKKEIIVFNKLLKPGKNYYKYAICSKTGYHLKAKYNLLSVAKKDNRTLIAVVLGCPNDDSRYEDTIKLFDTAFSEKIIEKIIIKKERMFFAKIEGSSRVLKANMLEDLNVEYYPSEEMQIRAQIIWDELKAPIKKGQKVATINLLTKENEVIKAQDVYSSINVKRTFFFILKNFFVKR